MTLVVTLTASAKTYTDTSEFDSSKMAHTGHRTATPSSSDSSTSPTACIGTPYFNTSQARVMQQFKCPIDRCNHHDLAACSLVASRFSIVPKPLSSSGGRLLKQGDSKNAFRHPVLPPDEVVVIKPPHGCPIVSKCGNLLAPP